MSSETIHRSSEPSVLTVSPGAKKIFQAIYRAQNGASALADDTTARLQVSDVISKMAFYYEKIRNAVHYREEHLLRKDAIERILKRQIIIENPIKFSRIDVSASARHLLIELIRAGYLPNNSLPETVVDEVSAIIAKYLELRRFLPSADAGNLKFVIGLAASEIEELIGPDTVSKTIMSVMYSLLEKRFELPVSLPYEQDLPIQLYLSIHRSFLKFDEDMLSLILLRYFNGDWETANKETVQRIAKNASSLRRLIEAQLHHPIAGRLDRVVSSYTVFFTILKDVISEDPELVYDEFFEDPKAFRSRIKKACIKRYGVARTKLWRSAWRSIIYILLTKSVFAALLEIPAARLFGSVVSPIALAINISFPALLLFMAVAISRLPNDENTKRIIAGLEEIVFNEKRRDDPIQIRKPIGRHPIMNVIFGLVYTVTFFISFGAVVWLLEIINFSWVSTVIFLFFLAFVSFFIIRIRRNAKEWIVVETRDSFSRFVLDFFSTPVVATGKWLTGKFSRINVFVFVLDFIIEAPFKIFVDIAEEWTKYVRERKDQL